MISRLLQIFLFLLPLHGGLVVFGFEGIRYWKEVFLLLFVLYWVVVEGKIILNKKSVHLSREQYIGIGFLVWLVVLVLLNGDMRTSLLSVRYLGVGVFVYLLFSRLCDLSILGKKDITVSLQAFVYGCICSVLFGIWAHFLGGYGVLSHWYSHTISSWVPGQTIPLYHETEGLIRMQGMSSGPVEFAHLLFLGLGVLCISSFSKQWKWGIGILLLTGTILSLTRAVWLALLLGSVVYLFQNRGTKIMNWIPAKIRTTKASIWMFLGGVFVVGGILFSSSSVQDHLLRRAGTSDHITRPIEAFQKGLEHPLTGSLGELGPAARTKNLALHNNDKALIAENVFVDVFAQTGIVGFLFYVLFIISLWKKLWKKKYVSWIVASLVVLNLATVFDMTPLSIGYFACMAFLVHKKG